MATGHRRVRRSRESHQEEVGDWGTKGKKVMGLAVENKRMHEAWQAGGIYGEQTWWQEAKGIRGSSALC